MSRSNKWIVFAAARMERKGKTTVIPASKRCKVETKCTLEVDTWPKFDASKLHSNQRFERCPEAIVAKIAGFLGIRDSLRCGSTCRTMYVTTSRNQAPASDSYCLRVRIGMIDDEADVRHWHEKPIQVFSGTGFGGSRGLHTWVENNAPRLETLDIDFLCTSDPKFIKALQGLQRLKHLVFRLVPRVESKAAHEPIARLIGERLVDSAPQLESLAILNSFPHAFDLSEAVMGLPFKCLRELNLFNTKISRKWLHQFASGEFDGVAKSLRSLKIGFCMFEDDDDLEPDSDDEDEQGNVVAGPLLFPSVRESIESLFKRYSHFEMVHVRMFGNGTWDRDDDGVEGDTEPLGRCVTALLSFLAPLKTSLIDLAIQIVGTSGAVVQNSVVMEDDAHTWPVFDKLERLSLLYDFAEEQFSGPVCIWPPLAAYRKTLREFTARTRPDAVYVWNLVDEMNTYLWPHLERLNLFEKSNDATTFDRELLKDIGVFTEWLQKAPKLGRLDTDILPCFELAVEYSSMGLKELRDIGDRIVPTCENGLERFLLGHLQPFRHEPSLTVSIVPAKRRVEECDDGGLSLADLLGRRMSKNLPPVVRVHDERSVLPAAFFQQHLANALRNDCNPRTWHLQIAPEYASAEMMRALMQTPFHRLVVKTNTEASTLVHTEVIRSSDFCLDSKQGSALTSLDIRRWVVLRWTLGEFSTFVARMAAYDRPISLLFYVGGIKAQDLENACKNQTRVFVDASSNPDISLVKGRGSSAPPLTP